MKNRLNKLLYINIKNSRVSGNKNFQAITIKRAKYMIKQIIEVTMIKTILNHEPGKYKYANLVKKYVITPIITTGKCILINVDITISIKCTDNTNINT